MSAIAPPAIASQPQSPATPTLYKSIFEAPILFVRGIYPRFVSLRAVGCVPLQRAEWQGHDAGMNTGACQILVKQRQTR
ncbi:hypothetical protein GT370_19350 [Acidocella sp. MX-AZ03]|uniref:hypothetical protein n=1 Tax=Acidocella sp. MX-AZ03 TaxID=2697363 RepID=UPI0022DD68AE|nr:hypothetical protein [Acidocella sp. MX-AZ03]WBO61268.1 hypothetical protein GT370_19350 [Acidocella sp. MX-AZ03]